MRHLVEKSQKNEMSSAETSIQVPCFELKGVKLMWSQEKLWTAHAWQSPAKEGAL